MRAQLAAAMAMMLGVACVIATYADVACDTSTNCPDGWECGPSHLCVLQGQADAGATDGGASDAGNDGGNSVPENGALGASCTMDTQCDDGPDGATPICLKAKQTSTSGFCTDECGASTQCISNFCLGNLVAGGEFTPSQGACVLTCTSSADCPFGLACEPPGTSGGFCAFGCLTFLDCASSLTCDAATGKCGAPSVLVAGPEAGDGGPAACGFTTDATRCPDDTGPCLIACDAGQICTPSGTCETPTYSTVSGTVTDGVTGLIWQQSEGQAAGLNAAASYCQALNLGNYDGQWALPTVRQLYSLIESGQTPAIASAFQTPVAGSDGGEWTQAEYWPSGAMQPEVWGIDPTSGALFQEYASGGPLAVRCVR